MDKQTQFVKNNALPGSSVGSAFQRLHPKQVYILCRDYTLFRD